MGTCNVWNNPRENPFWTVARIHQLQSNLHCIILFSLCKFLYHPVISSLFGTTVVLPLFLKEPQNNMQDIRQHWHCACKCLSTVFAYIYCSFIPLACAECDDSLLFLGASSIPLCYISFPSTLFHQLVFHPPSLHLAIYFLVYLSALFPNSYIILFGNSIFFHSLYMPKPTQTI